MTMLDRVKISMLVPKAMATRTLVLSAPTFNLLELCCSGRSCRAQIQDHVWPKINVVASCADRYFYYLTTIVCLWFIINVVVGALFATRRQYQASCKSKIKLRTIDHFLGSCIDRSFVHWAALYLSIYFSSGNLDSGKVQHRHMVESESHEGPDARVKRDDLSGMDAGYTIDHQVESGQLITLFSAPDYPQFQATDKRFNNRGAYIVLQPPHFSSPIFHTFEAVKPRPQVKPYYDYEEVIDSDEELDLRSMDNGSSIGSG